MFEKVKNLVAEHEEAIPPEQITESTNFYMDLGWTSMDMMGCVIDLEDILGREIPDDGRGHAGPCRRKEPQDAGFRLARTACFLGPKIVTTGPGMGVQHEQLLVFRREQTKQLAESHMLQDFREVASVKCVPIVHGSL